MNLLDEPVPMLGNITPYLGNRVSPCALSITLM
jgi:hypothetical protein